MSYLVDVKDALRTGARAIRSVAAWPILLRLLIFGTGLAAVAVALPAGMSAHSRLLTAGLLALLPALGPGSWTVTAMELVAVVGWVVHPFTANAPLTWVLLAALAAALYVHHSAAALAATMPMDTALATVVPLAWLRRTAVAVAGTVVLAAVGYLLTGHLRVSTSVAVPVVGVVAAVLVLALLVRAVRRGGEGGPR